MATYDTLTAVDNYMKEYYGNFDAVEAVYSKKYKLLSMIPKKSTVGNPMKIPMLITDGAGVSGNLVSASASAAGVTPQAFFVQPGDFVSVVPLDFKVMEAAESEGSFIDYVDMNIQAKLNSLGRTHARFLFGNGGGSIGRRASISVNTITLSSPEDTINFWPGMVLRASTGDGTSGAHTQKTGSTAVQSVNRESGTVTVVSAAAISGFADNDYLFIDGLFAGDQSQISVMKGLAAWFTPTAATDTLWTVARTNYPELSGYRNPNAATAGGVVDRMRALATIGDRVYGATPSIGVLYSEQWEVASKTLQNQGFRPIEVSETETMAGYKKLSIIGQYGDVSLIGEPFCPQGLGYMLDMETLQMAHLGEKLVNFAKSPDGQNMYVPSTSVVGYDIRIVSYPNLACNAPWKNGVTPLPALP
jgi:hypothetical protein